MDAYGFKSSPDRIRHQRFWKTWSMSSSFHNPGIAFHICNLRTVKPRYQATFIHFPIQPPTSNIVVPSWTPSNLEVVPKQAGAINTGDLKDGLESRTGGRYPATGLALERALSFFSVGW